MALGGCRKAALFIGLGCFGIVLIMVVGFALLVWWANRQVDPQGPSQPQAAALAVPLAGPPAASPLGAPPTAAGATAVAVGASAVPLRVALFLEEGTFTIEPGAPGSDLVAEGTFDPNVYELTTEESGSVETGREVTIRFQAKKHWLMRLLSHFGEDARHDEAHLLIRLPEGQPMALDVKIAKGQSRTELGGLALTDLTADFAMGEAVLSFARPLPAPLPRLTLRSAMGELGVEGLGQTGASSLDVDGSMGEIRLDLGGDWRPGTTTKAEVRHAMGEVTLIVPRGVRLAPSSSTLVILGGSQAPGARDDADLPADAPVLELDAAVSMGNLKVQRR